MNNPTARKIVVVLDNIRSTHNVGSILRTCDGLGITSVVACGITPHMYSPISHRLPHERRKIEHLLHKTALGAEHTVQQVHAIDTRSAIQQLKNDGFTIAALEQDPRSVSLITYARQTPAAQPIAIVVGTEVTGITTDVLQLCDHIIEIPMLGQKESFNVAVATGIALFTLTFVSSP